MKVKILVVVLILSLFVVGCGGAGESSAEAASPADVVPDDIPDDILVWMDRLRLDIEFDRTPTYDYQNGILTITHPMKISDQLKSSAETIQCSIPVDSFIRDEDLDNIVLSVESGSKEHLDLTMYYVYPESGSTTTYLGKIHYKMHEDEFVYEDAELYKEKLGIDAKANRKIFGYYFEPSTEMQDLCYPRREFLAGQTIKIGFTNTVLTTGWFTYDFDSTFEIIPCGDIPSILWYDFTPDYSQLIGGCNDFVPPLEAVDTATPDPIPENQLCSKYTGGLPQCWAVPSPESPCGDSFCCISDSVLNSIKDKAEISVSDLKCLCKNQETKLPGEQCSSNVGVAPSGLLPA
ncbi:MAG: hypothetical protein KKF44_05310 [Nanoarchaeota archaeon]|nr:hypothetical protein [Nanoarchaeota archaeon]